MGVGAVILSVDLTAVDAVFLCLVSLEIMQIFNRRGWHLGGCLWSTSVQREVGWFGGVPGREIRREAYGKIKALPPTEAADGVCTSFFMEA